MKRFLMIVAAALTVAVSVQAQEYAYKGLKMPQTGGGAKLETLCHTGFVTCYDTSDRIPVWVFWVLTKENLGEDVTSRTDEFAPDPSLGEKRQAALSDYRRSGWDRGHMCPAADNKWSVKAMTESFYLTNICPQNHGLNEGLWCEVEKRCRRYAKMYGKVYVACGPVLFGDEGKTIGDNKVRVPDMFWKAICAKDSEGRWKAIAFVMPNRDVDPAESVFTYAMSVDEMEKLTGVDVFGFVPEAEERKMEAEFDRAPWDIFWKK